MTDDLILILELYKHKYELSERSNVTGEKIIETRGDRKGQAFSINCRVTIRPVLREIAALYLNMNINGISLCWVLRALTF